MSVKILIKYLPLLIIISGLALRLTAFGQWPFGFDQVQIIDAAQKISQGDVTLIGPRTGPATLFTGPLIYYLTAVFYLLGFGYYSLIATTLLIAAVTAWCLHYFLKLYFDRQTALAGLVFWAFSFSFIAYDQVTWNPNLTILSALLLFFPLFGFLKSDTIDTKAYLFIFLGSFLAYQAHFSGFLLLPLSVLFLLGKNKVRGLIGILTAVLGLIFSLLPTLLFDFRNNWMNTRGLLEFFNKVGNGGNSQEPYVFHLWKSFYTSFENIGSLVFNNFSLPLQIVFVLGFIVIVYYVFLKIWKRKYDPTFLLPVFWVAIITGIFSLYSGDKPPYYFLIQTSAVILMYLIVFNDLKSKYDFKIFWILFILLATTFNFYRIFVKNPFSITSAIHVKEYIVQQTAQSKINKFVFHVPIGEQFGLEYALRDLPVGDSGGANWYFSYPDKVVFAQENFDGMSAWSQPAVTDSENIYFDNSFRIQTKDDLRLYRDNYFQGTADQNYLVQKNEDTIGFIEVYAIDRFSRMFPEHRLQGSNNWQQIDGKNFLWYYPPSNKVFWLKLTNENTDAVQELYIF